MQAGDKVIAVVERVTTNTRQYLHRDHQGSVVKVTNASGSVDQALAFDAWGLRRNASDWSPLGSPFAGSHETERGYTGHEHLDTVGLIHMNGRVQDPVLGRFISADPLIQSPYSTQSHNRYSYVWNNPASLSDPSGFCAVADCMSAGALVQSCLNGTYEQFTNNLLWLQNQASAQEGRAWDQMEFLGPLTNFGLLSATAHSNYSAQAAPYRRALTALNGGGPLGEWLFPEGGPKDPRQYEMVILNGITESREDYQALATAADAAVYYNPTEGFVRDLFESVGQRLFGGADPFAAEFAADMAGVSHAVNFHAYSQGTLTVINAIEHHGFNPSGHTFVLSSPAFPRAAANRYIADNGGSYEWDMPKGDVARLYSGRNPFTAVTGVRDIFCSFCKHSGNSPVAP